MNYYEWTIPRSMYTNTSIIVAGDSLDDCLKRLKANAFKTWKDVQSGFKNSNFNKEFEEYLLSQIDSVLLKNKIDSHRTKVFNSCLNRDVWDWYKKASNYEIVERDSWYFRDFVIDQFIENNLIDGKTPWFVEPSVSSIDRIFYIDGYND